MQNILNHRRLARQLAAAVLALMAVGAPVHADIFQWEYIDPADPSQGKRQSTALAPDGAGVDAGPGAYLSYRDLTMAHLANARLVGTNFSSTDLSNANLSGTDLSAATFLGATLTDADLSDASVGSATFGQAIEYVTPPFCFPGIVCGYTQLTGTGITLPQLYSTGSYKARDLTGIWFKFNNLSGADFSGQKLAEARFDVSQLFEADFQRADLTYASFADSNINQASFREADLTGAHFVGAYLSNADFTGADIRGASFARGPDVQFGLDGSRWLLPNGSGSGITPAQLDTTASYQSRNLIGTDFAGNRLAGADFTGQDLTNSNFAAANLTGANFTGALIAGARFDTTYLTHSYVSGRTSLLQAGSGITLAQLYSTASYAARDLSGVSLIGSNLTGGNFADQNLTNANLLGSLANADLTRANLSDATLGPLSGAVLSGAEIRGARFQNSGLTIAQLYTTASYQARDLTNVSLEGHDLSGGNFSRQNLTNVNFGDASLKDALFADAVINGAKFFRGYNLETALTSDQLYSTASYKARNLQGVDLRNVDLSGWNFAGQDLTNASLVSARFTDEYTATLTDADFSGAWVDGTDFSFSPLIAGATSGGWIDPSAADAVVRLTENQLYSTASYQARNLNRIRFRFTKLNGWNFADQNLSDADLSFADLRQANLSNADLSYVRLTGADLDGADLTGANVRGADFSGQPIDGGGGITLAQLYSTASYQARDLAAINLGGSDLTGGNFAGQNLTNASAGSPPIGTDFTGADLRGSSLYPVDALTTNLIWADGRINGLTLDAGDLLALRDYRDHHGNPLPFPITVDEELTMVSGGTLRMVFEADAWDSTVSFAPGIPVTLGGTLELTFAADVNLASQVGRTFHIFDWTGVTPSGAFAISSSFAWDLSNLYITGEVTLTAVPEPNSLLTLLLGLLLAGTSITATPRRVPEKSFFFQRRLLTLTLRDPGKCNTFGDNHWY